MHIHPHMIVQVSDPVAALASQGIEVLMNQQGWLEACNKIVFREMGLHPSTMVGGDENDRAEFYNRQMEASDLSLIDIVEMSAEEKKDVFPDFIMDDDPRHQLYYELLANLHSQVFAEMIASQKYRWRPDFVTHRAQAQAQVNTAQKVMGETNG